MFKRYLIIVSILLVTLIPAQARQASNQLRWVDIGESDYSVGATKPYSLKLYLPYGARELDDVREFLYPMKFELVWNEAKLSSDAVSAMFRNQIKEHFGDKEGFKLNKYTIAWFLKKLPAIVKGDQWVFEYNPDQGIQLFLNDKLVHTIIGAQLNRALLKSWMEKNPFITSKLLTKLLRIQ